MIVRCGIASLMLHVQSSEIMQGEIGLYRLHKETIWGQWNSIQNRGNTHLPDDCWGDWHFDFFPASLMLMIWLWMGDLHRVWAIWVQFPSWGWKHIDCPLMVFMGGLLSSRPRCYWTAFTINAELILCNHINKSPANIQLVWCCRYTLA